MGIMMKYLEIGFLLLLSALLSSAARAQWIVNDPINLIENMMTAANTLQQVNNQLRQLENDAQMLQNEGRQLTSLNFSALNSLRTTLATTMRLLQEAEGLGYTVNGIDSTFNRLYPLSYPITASYPQMAVDARERRTNVLQAVHTSLRMQAQASQNLSSDENALAQLVNRSQAAVGQLQATQATNQLLALQSRQAIQEQQLRITQDRATVAEQARHMEIAEQAREQQRRFLGNGTPYTTTPVSFYNN